VGPAGVHEPKPDPLRSLRRRRGCGIGPASLECFPLRSKAGVEHAQVSGTLDLLVPTRVSEPSWEVFDMKKVWSKPVVCVVEAGFEISRYLPAEVRK
jgi:hypothetical protein